MKHNVGSFDGGVRFVLGCTVLWLGVHFYSWWGLLGLVPLLTGICGFCPLYCVFHLNTQALENSYEERSHSRKV